MSRPTIALITASLVASVLLLGGCGRTRPPQIGSPKSSTPPSTVTSAADQLAGLAAAALDRRYVAGYTYHVSGSADRTVVVSVATDGSWSVNVPGGALSGGADVSIVSNTTGVYQCVLGGRATSLAPPPPATPGPETSASPGPSSSPAPPGFTAPACAKVAAARRTVPARFDPLVEHVFTDWLTAMSSRNEPISVFPAARLTASSGTCFSVEPSAASLAPVVRAGIYCFRPDGTITAVKLAAGTLTLVGNEAPAAPTTALPAPITNAGAAPVRSPLS